MIDTILNWFKKPAEETKDKAPEGVCPVCWGYQKYDHKIRTLYYDRQIDVNNHKEHYSFMRDFIKKHIDGIKLKEGEISTCPECGHQEK